MHEKPLRFGCMDENKTSFFFKKINNVFYIFLKKIKYVDTRFVSYYVNLWPVIR